MDLNFSESNLDYSDDDVISNSPGFIDEDEPTSYEDELRMEEEAMRMEDDFSQSPLTSSDDFGGNEYSSPTFNGQPFEVPSFDNSKIDKLKKRLTVLISALLALVVLSLIFTGYNLAKQKSQRDGIESWVKSYLGETLSNKEMSEGELDRIANEVSYRLYDNVPVSSVDFATLTDTQIYEIVAKVREPLVQTLTTQEAEIMAQKILVEYYRDKNETSQSASTSTTVSTSNEDSSDIAVLKSRIETLTDNVKQLQTKTSTAGAQGVQGIQGVKGDTGAMGPQGLRGEKGERGETGATGAAGRDGQDGRDGRDGQDGLQGEKGDAGKSAYESYVDVEKANGRTPMSESDWVESLKGMSYTDELKQKAKLRYEYFKDEVDAEFEALDADTKALYEDALDYYTQKYVKEQIIDMLTSAGITSDTINPTPEAP